MHALCTRDQGLSPYNTFVIMTTSYYVCKLYLASVQKLRAIPLRIRYAFLLHSNCPAVDTALVLSKINHPRSQTSPHFLLLHHHRPGAWLFSPISSSSARPCSGFDFGFCPFPHLLIVAAEPIPQQVQHHRPAAHPCISVPALYSIAVSALAGSAASPCLHQLVLRACP